MAGGSGQQTPVAHLAEGEAAAPGTDLHAEGANDVTHGWADIGMCERWSSGPAPHR